MKIVSRTPDNLQDDDQGIVGCEVIPDKVYFKIGEVCEITGIKQHVLRYWESEFKIIRPVRGLSKQRLYRRVDVENILKIKRLLYEDGFTLPGAKKVLSQKQSSRKPEAVREIVSLPKDDFRNFCRGLKADLIQLEKMLKE